MRRSALAADGGAGTEVDDPPAPVSHVAEGSQVREHSALHVDGEDAIPVVFGDLLGRRASLDPGRVDEHIEAAGIGSLPTERDAALNERMYGELQGKNKAEAAARFGADQVKLWRRSYDVKPPGRESLADTAARVLPYWESHILPDLQAGKNVLVVAHGNSLRALVMHLDRLSREQVIQLEIPTGVPLLYEMAPDGMVRGKRDL